MNNDAWMTVLTGLGAATGAVMGLVGDVRTRWTRYMDHDEAIREHLRLLDEESLERETAERGPRPPLGYYWRMRHYSSRRWLDYLCRLESRGMLAPPPEPHRPTESSERGAELPRPLEPDWLMIDTITR